MRRRVWEALRSQCGWVLVITTADDWGRWRRMGKERKKMGGTRKPPPSEGSSERHVIDDSDQRPSVNSSRSFWMKSSATIGKVDTAHSRCQKDNSLRPRSGKSPQVHRCSSNGPHRDGVEFLIASTIMAVTEHRWRSGSLWLPDACLEWINSRSVFVASW